LSTRLRHFALAAALVLVAGAIRWPYLQLVPRLTDETEEAQFALGIAREGELPLVSVDPYNGPLFHYILALGFAAGGGPEWPRVFVLVVGALTVGVTFFLGSSLARLWAPQAANSSEPMVAGAVAALLMAVSFIPVTVNSHIAWSNSTTPFWTALFLLAVVEARRRERPGLLIPAGALAGLALQTHPSALALLVGGAVWIVLQRPRWLRARGTWLGLAVAIVAIGNLLAYNLMTAGGSVAFAAEERDYAFTVGAFGAAYAANVAGFARLGYQLVTSTFLATIDETTDPVALRAVLLHPMAVMSAVAAAAAVLVTGRRAGLALWCWIAALLIVPLFNQAYHHYILARYLAALLPPTLAAIGVVAAAGLCRSTSGSGAKLQRGGWRVARALLSAAVTLALIGYPVGRLRDFYSAEMGSGKNNARLWQLLPVMESTATEDSPIWVDRELRHTRLTAGGNLFNVPSGLLDMAGIPHERLKEAERLDLPLGAIVLLSDAGRDAVAGVLVLEAVGDHEALAAAAPGGYALYRVAGRMVY
jgi:4-amino-4-deoxy-L-arabinose transferase-like glycosyltransferase